MRPRDTLPGFDGPEFTSTLFTNLKLSRPALILIKSNDFETCCDQWIGEFFKSG